MKPLVAEPPGTVWDPMYPDSDGRPMGETDHHSEALITLRQGLKDYFADRSDVYVGSNLLFYYERGNPSGRRDPDGLVAKGVRGNHRRRSYRLWEEGVLPCALFEILSENTWREDVGEKRELYERLRIPEYFLFDPEDRFIDPPLQGFRLVKGRYEPIVPAEDGSLVSEQLGLRMKAEGTLLRLIDLKTGKPVLTRAERAAQEEERAKKEKQRAKQAKEDAEKAKGEAEKAKEDAEKAKEDAEKAKGEAEKAKGKADKASRRARKERERAKKEKERAAELAAEVERLRKLLGEDGPAG